jgi:hypothetical protein
LLWPSTHILTGMCFIHGCSMTARTLRVFDYRTPCSCFCCDFDFMEPGRHDWNNRPNSNEAGERHAASQQPPPAMRAATRAGKTSDTLGPGVHESVRQGRRRGDAPCRFVVATVGQGGTTALSFSRTRTRPRDWVREVPNRPQH